jgi:hypothetical protein
MKRSIIGVTMMLLLALAIQPNLLRAAEEKGAPKDCCFEHPNYQGTCTVTPAKDESCQTILDYLNTQGSSNKTYCGSTRIRGGWSQADCKQDEPEQKSGETPAPGPTPIQ